MTQGNFYLGCAVWAYRDWVGDFYPQGSSSSKFLRLYCDRLTAVEGNTTFYSVPGPAMVERWHQEMPPNFQFCLKLPREISHNGLLQQGLEDTRAFLARMSPLGSRLGPVFMQLPPSYSPAKFDDLQQFLTAWPTLNPSPSAGTNSDTDPTTAPSGVVPLAVEVRHPGWFRPEPAKQLNELLQSLGMGRVLLDTRAIYDGPDDPQRLSQRKKPKLPLQPVLTAPFTLVRWITHPDRDRNQIYQQEWAKRIARWLAQGVNIYLFVHCPQEIYSPGTARDFQHQLEIEGEMQGIAIPPLPWDQLASPPDQLSLF